MPALDEALKANREAVAAFHAAAAKNAATWSTPRAPGKWSPAEIAEHLAAAYGVAASAIAGRPIEGANLPRLLRPLLRMLAFTPTIRRRAFGRPVRTMPPMEPKTPARSPEEARRRLDDAVTRFEAAVRSSASATMEHSAFGTIGLADYVVFTEIHTLHHLQQLPAH